MRFLRTKDTKPYDKCIVCEHLGVCCDGPNFLAMTLERWCEWCRLRKEYLGLTNEKVAEEANISKVSVTRIMSLSGIKDIHLSTMQAVTRVLVGGTWGQYPCPLDTVSIPTDCALLQAELDRANERYQSARASIDHLKAQVAFNEKQIDSKDQQLKENDAVIRSARRVSAFLATMLGMSLFVILTALVIDRQNDHIGYFWINGMENHFGVVLAFLCVIVGAVSTYLLVRMRKPRKKDVAS